MGYVLVLPLVCKSRTVFYFSHHCVEGINLYMNDVEFLVEEQADCCLMDVHDNVQLTKNEVH